MTVSTDDIDLAALTLGKQKRYGHKSGTPGTGTRLRRSEKGPVRDPVAGFLVVLGLGT